jgi:hypothetical protein
VKTKEIAPGSALDAVVRLEGFARPKRFRRETYGHGCVHQSFTASSSHCMRQQPRDPGQTMPYVHVGRLSSNLYEKSSLLLSHRECLGPARR